MRRILLATDLEADSENSAAFALAIAHELDAELTVYHAYGRPDLSQANLTPEEREARVLTKMRELMASVTGPSFGDVVVRYDADVDYPGDGVLGRVADGDFDLLTFGLRGHVANQNQFSGLAQRFFTEADTSILAIPPGATFQGVREIVFASDLDREDEVVLEQLQTWRRAMGAELYVVHVYDDGEDRDRAREVMTRWRDRYASAPNLHFELMAGDFEHDIGAYVRQRGGDMLVLQSHTRGLFGRLFGHSAAEEIAHTVEVPLLVMRGEG